MKTFLLLLSAMLALSWSGERIREEIRQSDIAGQHEVEQRDTSLGSVIYEVVQ